MTRTRRATPRPLESKASLSEVRRHIRADLRAVDADPSAAFDCLVAVTEACTYAILHGARGPWDAASCPYVSWEIDRTRASFRVQDFSPEQWARAVHPSRGAEDAGRDLEARVTGLGTELMQGLMDDVEVSCAAGCTVVVLTKLLA